jgi:hypothetical protein
VTNESKDTGLLRELLYELDAGVGIAQRQVCHGLDARAGGQHALDQPAVVGTGQLHLNLELRVRAKGEHGRRKKDRVVDRHLAHRVEQAGGDRMSLLAGPFYRYVYGRAVLPLLLRRFRKYQAPPRR